MALVIFVVAPLFPRRTFNKRVIETFGTSFESLDLSVADALAGFATGGSAMVSAPNV
jgi:hypothetical protein